MRTIRLIPLILAAACASTGGPKTLVNRAVEATGGNSALAAIQHYHIGGEGDYMGMPYTVVVHYREPGDWRWDLTAEGMEMSQLVLGGEAYISSGGGKSIVQEGGMKAQMLGHVHLGNCVLLPNRLLADNVKIEPAAKVMVDGAECPALRAHFPGDQVATFVFDPERGLIRQVHFDMLDEATGKKVPAVSEFSEWETVGEVRVATQIQMTWGSAVDEKSLGETRNDIRWNPPIPASIFAEPDVAPPVQVAVKQLPAARVVEYTFVSSMTAMGNGVTEAMEWTTANGGVSAGPPTMLWRKPPTDPADVETVIQLPVRMGSAPAAENARLLKRPSFLLAYASYEGHVSGCWLIAAPVTEWTKKNGYRISGPMRVTYLTSPDASGMVKAEVGFPVARRAG